MADLTPLQLRWLHDELGDSVTDADLQAAYDDLGSVRDVALSVIRKRREALLESPLSVSLAGVASTNAAENVKALERRLAALTRLDDDPSSTPGEDVDGGGGTPGTLQLVQMRRSRGR